ncbi:MAG TPA: Clp protease N-terminal domain-containing protein [Streptosporangiaceae bacterium]|nr:Clp protease N-terminal domain-containing protein [Streptosporangiaceae bacterium]
MEGDCVLRTERPGEHLPALPGPVDWPLAADQERTLARSRGSARRDPRCRGALAAAVDAAVGLGHNYVGSEHLLLGLKANPDTVAARALHQHRVQAVDVRRALLSALAGFTRGRQAGALMPADQIEDLARRVAAVNERLAAIAG